MGLVFATQNLQIPLDSIIIVEIIILYRDYSRRDLSLGLWKGTSPPAAYSRMSFCSRCRTANDISRTLWRYQHGSKSGSPLGYLLIFQRSRSHFIKSIFLNFHVCAPIQCIFYVPASRSAVSPWHNAWWCRFSGAPRAAGLARWAFPYRWPM